MPQKYSILHRQLSLGRYAFLPRMLGRKQFGTAMTDHTWILPESRYPHCDNNNSNLTARTTWLVIESALKVLRERIFLKYHTLSRFIRKKLFQLFCWALNMNMWPDSEQPLCVYVCALCALCLQWYLLQPANKNSYRTFLFFMIWLLFVIARYPTLHFAWSLPNPPCKLRKIKLKCL